MFDVDWMAVTIFTKITSMANMKNKKMHIAKFVYCEYVNIKLLFCWWWWKMLLLCRFDAISLIFGSTTLTNDCTGPAKRNRKWAIFNDLSNKWQTHYSHQWSIYYPAYAIQKWIFFLYFLRDTFFHKYSLKFIRIFHIIIQ